ncbi:MAG: hypothetical protein KF770_02340 [Anaerolineae bacterium]|nr:hypothetical protein [Anaerolineae bacterium]
MGTAVAVCVGTAVPVSVGGIVGKGVVVGSGVGDGGTAVLIIVCVGATVRVGGTAVTSTSGGLQATSQHRMLTKKAIFHQRSINPSNN